MGAWPGREAGKSPLLIGCWGQFRGALVRDLRGLGISLWQTVSYDELDLLVVELLADPESHLVAAIASAPEVVDPETQRIMDEARSEYQEKYGL